MTLSPERYQIQIPIHVTDYKIDFQLFWRNVSAGSGSAFNWVLFRENVRASPAGECRCHECRCQQCQCQQCQCQQCRWCGEQWTVRVWTVSLTGLDALGLVVGLGAGVALLHLQQQAVRWVLRAPGPSAGRGSRPVGSFVLRRPFSGSGMTFAALGRADTHLLGNALLIQRMRSQLVSQELEHYWASLALASSLAVRAHCALVSLFPEPHRTRSYSPHAYGKRSKNILNLNNISAHRSHATAPDRLPRTPDYY